MRLCLPSRRLLAFEQCGTDTCKTRGWTQAISVSQIGMMSYPSVAWRPEQVVGLARSMAVRMHTVNAAATTLTAPSPSAIVALRPLGPCWIATGHTTPVEQRRLYYWSARFSSWSASQYFANTTRALQAAFNDPYLGVCKLLCPDPTAGCMDTISTPCTSVSHDQQSREHFVLSTDANWFNWGGQPFAPGDMLSAASGSNNSARLSFDWFEHAAMRGGTTLWTEDWCVSCPRAVSCTVAVGGLRDTLAATAGSAIALHTTGVSS